MKIPSTLVTAKENADSPLREADRQTLRDRVKSMTADELAKTIEDINGPKAMPEIFRETDVQDAIAKRMEEVDVTMETKDRWEMLRSGITTDSAATEEKFKEEVEKKGGFRYRAGKFILTIMSWLGFKKAKDLKDSLEKKGYLRTAAESAVKYPVFASFLARIGMGAGSGIRDYLKENEGGITKILEEKIKTGGEDPENVVNEYADKVKNIAEKAKTGGAHILVRGMAFIFNGTYDEETGVAQIPSLLGEDTTIRPPIVTALQAGNRIRNGDRITKVAYSIGAVERNVQTFLRDALKTDKKLDAVTQGKKALAERALEIIRKNGGFAVTGAEGHELSSIIETLEGELGFKPRDVMQTVNMNPADLDKHRKEVLANMEQVAQAEKSSFETTQNKVQQLLRDADERIKTGNHPGSADVYKQTVMDEVNKITTEFNDKAAGAKVAEAQKGATLMNMLSAQAQVHLDGSDRPNVLNRGLQATASGMESLGFGLVRTPAGFLVKGVAAYSFLPLATEAVAAFTGGKAGEAAKKAVMYDVGEAVAGFIPFVGNLVDFRAAATGTDMNGRELDTWGRVSSAAFGTLGMTADVLGFFTAGTTSIAYRVARGTIGGVKAFAKGTDTVRTVGAAGDVVRSMNAAGDTMRNLENMYSTSAQTAKTTNVMRKALGVVRGAQHGMQIVTYGNLGISMACGISTVAENVGGALDKVGDFAGKAAAMVSAGADATVEAAGNAKDFVIDKIPFHSNDASANV